MMQLYNDDGNVSEPECFFKSVAVRDPYSTDEEHSSEIKNDEENTGSHLPVRNTSYSVNGTNVQTLKLYFNVQICQLAQNPTCENLRNKEMLHVIDSLILFLTERKDLSANEIVQYVLSLNNSGKIIRLLYENEAYAFNLKTQNLYWNHIKFDKADIPVEEMICNRFLIKIIKLLMVTLQVQSSEPKKHHDLVKSIMNVIGEILSQDYITNSETVLRTEAIGSASSKEAKAVNKSKEPEIFEATSDVLLGNLSSKRAPTIPVEVYNPLEQKEKHSPGASGKTTYHVEEVLSEDKSNVELSNFLKKNTPCYTCQHPTTCQQHFKDELVAKHVLQVISSAVAHTCNSELTGHQKAYLGLFVNNEYVYLSKIVSDDRNLRRYSLGFFLQPKDWFNCCIVPSDIYVQFSPLVLDMSLHHHRLALLFFCKYYLCQWHKIDMNFTASGVVPNKSKKQN